MKKKLSIMKMFENNMMQPEQGKNPFDVDIVQLAQQFKQTKDPQIGKRLMQILQSMATGGPVQNSPVSRPTPKFGVSEGKKRKKKLI